MNRKKKLIRRDRFFFQRTISAYLNSLQYRAGISLRSFNHIAATPSSGEYILYIYLHNAQQHVLFFHALPYATNKRRFTICGLMSTRGERYISYFLRDSFVTHSSYEYLPIYLQMSRARFSLFFNNECSFTRKIYPRKRNRFVCAIKESMKLILRQSREDYLLRDFVTTFSYLMLIER